MLLFDKDCAVLVGNLPRSWESHEFDRDFNTEKYLPWMHEPVALTTSWSCYLFSSHVSDCQIDLMGHNVTKGSSAVNQNVPLELEP